MARQRKNAPTGADGKRKRQRPAATGGELVLSDEELLALADEGVDPADVERLEHEVATTDQEASEHDRDTVRDELEGLVVNHEEQY